MAGTKCGHDDELLRQVLLGLGFHRDQLGNLRDVEGVEWRPGLQRCLFRFVSQAL